MTEKPDYMQMARDMFTDGGLSNEAFIAELATAIEAGQHLGHRMMYKGWAVAA